jgi:hypothetical protein
MTTGLATTVDSREGLIFLLAQAGEIEHVLICEYLFAGLSLKTADDEGLTPAQLDATRRWQRLIWQVVAQEMLHLALANNLLTAIGAAPHFRRPNFPQIGRYYPRDFRFTLTRFDEATLQHFVYIERPEGMQADDPDLFGGVEPLAMPRVINEVGPDVIPFETIGELYRVIEDGFRTLAARHGEARLFIGPPAAQATERYFTFPALIAVTDLASALQAIEAIVEQGEGVRGDWQGAHYGKFLSIYQEFRALTGADPTFDPARPVESNPSSRLAPDSTGLTLIEEPFTMKISDYFNAAYDLLVQMLARFFAHTEETDGELKVLVQTAIDGMFSVILPLGDLLTRLPMGPSHPNKSAGPAFAIYRQTADVLPHARAAWLLFHERLLELAAFGDRLRAERPATPQLDAAAEGFRGMAARLEKVRRRNDLSSGRGKFSAQTRRDAAAERFDGMHELHMWQ